MVQRTILDYLSLPWDKPPPSANSVRFGFPRAHTSSSNWQSIASCLDRVTFTAPGTSFGSAGLLQRSP